jgi:hypothetical protein
MKGKAIEGNLNTIKGTERQVFLIATLLITCVVISDVFMVGQRKFHQMNKSYLACGQGDCTEPQRKTFAGKHYG